MVLVNNEPLLKDKIVFAAEILTKKAPFMQQHFGSQAFQVGRSGLKFNLMPIVDPDGQLIAFLPEKDMRLEVRGPVNVIGQIESANGKIAVKIQPAVPGLYSVMVSFPFVFFGFFSLLFTFSVRFSSSMPLCSWSPCSST